jgi:hypothetical protein
MSTDNPELIADCARPRGWRWWVHVLESGGYCLIRCPHYNDTEKPAGSTIPGSQPLGNEGQLSGRCPDGTATVKAEHIDGHE